MEENKMAEDNRIDIMELKIEKLTGKEVENLTSNEKVAMIESLQDTVSDLQDIITDHRYRFKEIRGQIDLAD